MSSIEGGDVVVCGNDCVICGFDDFCILFCEINQDCISVAYLICNVGIGQCECGSDSDCSMIGFDEFSVCIVNGFCGCFNDQQCVNSGCGDVCNDGQCGCLDQVACNGVESVYDGGFVVCN